MKSYASAASVVAVILSFASAGCSAPPTEGAAEAISTVRQPIINGEASPAAQDAVVLLGYSTDGVTGAQNCTGTLIGHKLVLTARHCVATFGDDGTITGDAPAKSFYVYPGQRAAANVADLSRAAARGAQLVVVPGATSMLDADIALLVLDRPIPGLIAPLRLDDPPRVGEELTLVGWGLTENDALPAMRLQRRGATVQGVGRAASTNQFEVGASEFRLGEGTCFGDSGGPSFAAKSMAIIGLVSRGGNGVQERSARACIGSDVEDIHTSVASFKPLIMEAFAAAGESPTLEPKAAAPKPAPPTSDTAREPLEETPEAPDEETTGRVAPRARSTAQTSAGCAMAPTRHGPTPLAMALGLGLALALLARRRGAFSILRTQRRRVPDAQDGNSKSSP